VVKRADELVLIDLPPQALLNRLQRGVVYEPEKAARALQNFFREPTLAALREMAIRQTAHEVDVRQPQPPATLERVLIHISEATSTAGLIRRGRRVADYLQADCFAVCVLPSADWSHVPAAEDRH
jgi:two-component system sensor histidine kinase KdpD